jgi:hypothetical protein
MSSQPEEKRRELWLPGVRLVALAGQTRVNVIRKVDGSLEVIDGDTYHTARNGA